MWRLIWKVLLKHLSGVHHLAQNKAMREIRLLLKPTLPSLLDFSLSGNSQGLQARISEQCWRHKNIWTGNQLSSPSPILPYGLFVWDLDLFNRLCPSAITTEHDKASRLNQAVIAPPRHIFTLGSGFLCSHSKLYGMSNRCELLRVPASLVGYVPLNKWQSAPSVLSGLKCQPHGWGKRAGFVFKHFTSIFA